MIFDETDEELEKRIMILNDRVWEGQMGSEQVSRWLKNFAGTALESEKERTLALYLLSHFMYFGIKEIRVLLRSLYRDLVLVPLLQEIRSQFDAVPTEAQLADLVNTELAKTRFFGIGNPSESGVHLLYYFRQENALPKSAFGDVGRIFRRLEKGGPATLREPNVKRYIFLDDLCGTGQTVIDYAENVLADIKSLDQSVEVAYYSLFATSRAIRRIRDECEFGENFAAVHELDDSYRCAEDPNRYIAPDKFPTVPFDQMPKLVRTYGAEICRAMGISEDHETGYKDSQLLIGFHHNTPDNTLPIIWFDSSHLPMQTGFSWTSAFKRYPKL